MFSSFWPGNQRCWIVGHSFIIVVIGLRLGRDLGYEERSNLFVEMLQHCSGFSKNRRVEAFRKPSLGHASKSWASVRLLWCNQSPRNAGSGRTAAKTGQMRSYRPPWMSTKPNL